jgi:hypothetical protein
MIICAVCGAQNDDLATVCQTCKAYIQAKVEILDLFTTIWGIIETPVKTFRRIALARTKNYTFFLSALIGCAATFGMFWYLNLGRRYEGLGEIFGVGLLAGPFVGLLLVGLMAVLAATLARVLRGSGSVKNAMAALAFAGIPIVLSFVVIFPIEIALFGKYLFDANPSPRVLNPLAYFVLFGLDAICMLWTVILAGIALAKAHGLSLPRGYVIAGVLVAIFVAGISFARGMGA